MYSNAEPFGLGHMNTNSPSPISHLFTCTDTYMTPPGHVRRTYNTTMQDNLLVSIMQRHRAPLTKFPTIQIPAVSHPAFCGTRREKRHALAGAIHADCPHWSETLDFLWDLSSFSERDSRTCHVASPSRIGSWNSRAFLTSGSHRLLCMVLRFVAATWARILPSCSTSSSATVREIAPHATAEGGGRRIPSAMMTGTQPSATDSTSRGLHGAHPKGHKQNVDRTISDW